MSTTEKDVSNALARINDATLGSFKLAPTSETLNHLIRYLSTWSGSDKLFMIVQYALKLVIPFLAFRARLQHKAGKRKEATSASAEAMNKLYGLIGDSRMLWRFWGLLPIYQWLVSIEHTPMPSRELLTLERLQGWSMLAYYPLEHLYYLRAHAIIPASLTLPFFKSWPLRLDLNKLSLWSTRFWALYVFLQLAHLREDRRELKKHERSLRKVKGKGKASEGAAENLETAKRWDALLNELVVNLGYLPLTIHWSLEKGLFKNDVWVGMFGLIAGLASFRSGWLATALPSTAVSQSIEGQAPEANSNALPAQTEASVPDEKKTDSLIAA